MICDELTNRLPAATTAPMQKTQSGKRWSGQRGIPALAVLLGGAVALSGCISVNAPDKPIVIELNINIKQEVIYKLAADAGNTIEDNPDIF
jgi:hypothetical protein